MGTFSVYAIVTIGIIFMLIDFYPAAQLLLVAARGLFLDCYRTDVRPQHTDKSRQYEGGESQV